MPRSPGVLAAVVLAHAAVIAALLSAPRAPQPTTPPQPLFVRLVESAPPPVALPAAPAPQPPRALPQAASAPVQPASAPHPVEAPAEPVRAETAPAVPTAPAAPAAPVVEAPRPAPPAPLVQPRFNADYLDNPKPVFPSLSRRMGEEGEVRLRVLVDAAGNAQQVEVERSSGFPRLDQAALDTVKRWRFVPARLGDQPVAAPVIVPIQFTLRN